MKVDRERFFVLVAAIAAGCRAVSAPPATPEVPIESDPQLAALAAPKSELPSRPELARDDRQGVPLMSTSTHEGGDVADPYTAVKIVGQSCDPWLNRRGFPRSCSPLTAPSPTCEDFDGEGFPETKAECGHLAERLAPRVAEKAVDCLLAKSGSRDLCFFNITGLCAYQALANVCVEPSAKPVCARIVKTCADAPEARITQEACEAGLSAQKDDQRPKFVACMTEFCDVGSCLSFW